MWALSSGETLLAIRGSGAHLLLRVPTIADH